jgi:spermidine synthase
VAAAFISGLSALIYEIVWFQLLELVIGSSTVSVGMLLAIFMGGTCLGSLVFPHLVSPRRHPLRVYALLEFGIGFFGVVVLLLMPLVTTYYTSWGGLGLQGLLLRGVVAASCLLPPTFLMGATLPSLSRALKATRIDVARLGFLYGANIAGAVIGCVVSGFYLLRLYDAATATYVAVALNAMIGGVAFFCPIEINDRRRISMMRRSISAFRLV